MLVVDASVAIKFVVEEPGSVSALELIKSPEPLIAPDWLLAEAANAIARKVNTEGLDAEKAARSFAELTQFFARLYPTADLLDSAFALSLRLKHAFYDCIYLALALAEDTILVTADRDFVASCERVGLHSVVRLLGKEGWPR